MQARHETWRKDLHRTHGGHVASGELERCIPERISEIEANASKPFRSVGKGDGNMGIIRSHEVLPSFTIVQLRNEVDIEPNARAKLADSDCDVAMN